jgi:hypothetical protein
MTLLDTERLGRKISELLQHVGNADIAPKLAADYATACHATNLRLQQCEAMVKAGDRPQAIQLAETAPNLLDLVTALEFRGSDEWRGYCQQNSLPVADRIDARSVQTLNQCYAQGIATDHPLYATYRSAVLSRNDEEALKTLQSIVRLNPADTNAASELSRLDAKVLTARLQHLGSSLEGAEPKLLVAEIETIEAFGFKNQPDDEIWRKAQVVRCACLLEEAAKLKDASRWLDTLAKLDFIHRLQAEFKLQLPAGALAKLTALESWARGEQEKDKKEQEFQSLLGKLDYQINLSEEKDTSSRYVKLPELRDDYEAMHKLWRSLTDFTRPIPEDATSSFRKRTALLDAEIARRTAIHRRIIFASSAAVLVVGAIIAWFVIGQMKVSDFSKQLQEAIAQRQVHTADKLLERAHSEKVGSANTIATAETFSAKEHALLSNFEASVNKLPQQLTGEADATRLASVADQLAQTHLDLNALAPDLKTENEPRIQAFEKQWQIFLTERGVAVNGLFDQWVSSAEVKCGEMDYRAPLEKTTAQIAELANLVQKITDTESGFTNHLNLRSDLLQRAATVRAKFTVYDGELKKLDEGTAAVRKARTVKEFSEGINVIASSEFSVSPAVVAALQVQSLNATDETVLRSLLGSTNAGTWAFIGKARTTHLIPEVVMPGERIIIQQLNSDPAVSAIHQRYRLSLDPEGKNLVEWITTSSFEASTGWKKITAWTPSASATSATFDEREYGYFDGQYKLSPTQPLYRVEQLDHRDETASFSSVVLEKVLTGGDSEGSPLFRAYLFLRLMDLMKLQPDAWGLSFCPAARTHEATIRSIVGEQFSSGDWFVPAKINALSDKLGQFFTSSKPISYARQADGLLALARAASKSGLQYAGFVGLDGKPNFIDDSISGEVFGYSAARKLPVLLAATIATGHQLREPALPLSPIFALTVSCQEFLTKAGVNPGDISFQGALPPLFQGMAQR